LPEAAVVIVKTVGDPETVAVVRQAPPEKLVVMVMVLPPVPVIVVRKVAEGLGTSNVRNAKKTSTPSSVCVKLNHWMSRAGVAGGLSLESVTWYWHLKFQSVADPSITI
jgi:hypothetical protein